MGYYKNIEVAMADDVTRYRRWFAAEGYKLDAVTRAWLDESAERLWKAIQMWEQLPAHPKAATDHVALQPLSRRQARRLEKAAEVIKLTKTDYWVLVGSVAAFGFLAIGLLLWLSRLV